MKKRIIIGLLLLTVFGVVTTAAQKTDAKFKDVKPDFTGKWVWELGGNVKYFHQMTIVQDGDEIKISDKIYLPTEPLVEIETKYFTDGRGEKNQLPEGHFSQSVTNWKGNKLIFTFYRVDSKNENKDKLGTISFTVKKNQLIYKKTSEDKNQNTLDIILSLNERNFVRVK